jgi:hypothetical protein
MTVKIANYFSIGVNYRIIFFLNGKKIGKSLSKVGKKRQGIAINYFF